MFKRYLPIFTWLPHYHKRLLGADLLAGLIVTVMVIPQSLAYALLAGLPAVVGLYASILPQLLYTFLGTSRTLAVGPVAIIALMTGAALSSVAAPGTPEYLQAALVLSLLSGAILVAMGALKMGFFSNYLSHPVISGFLTASGILIAVSQLGSLLGVSSSGFTLVERLMTLLPNLPTFNPYTVAIGGGTLLFLVLMRRYGKQSLIKVGLPAALADLMTKAGPVFAVVVTTLAAWHWQLAYEHGVAVVGTIPSGLPALSFPWGDASLWRALLIPAMLISLVGFVESVSMGQMLAAKRRQRISPNQELIGLGAANLAAGFTSGMPVTGGLSRTVINYDAGAQTPAAGAFAALGIALVTMAFTGWLYHLPIATLAATITVSILTLVDIPMLRQTWRYSRSDFAAMAVTILLTLVEGIEAGIIGGVTLSIALFLYRTSRPHSALVGRVPDTEHFRNVERHDVETVSNAALLRIDESLYFANARYLEDTVYNLVASRPELEHVVLICSAVNLIDASALESLDAINARLKDSDVKLHLSEVKGPVMDQLKKSDFLDALTGRVFLSTYAAWRQFS
ncbi:MAG TPA: sodium-independent anion transporter [Halomonas sp.]|jgi:SulP family sulfate permease|uniref:SulP family inorganic anion transporter n=1 Tax=Halomonadaceae TaxID=28256 RepID=UPI0007806E69|nr:MULTISPECIES: sulfate permease [Halomonas]MCC4290281.1 sulfate permease [Halomonas axialensis]MCD1649819.1 sulfate permease [Halomonas axialensis]MCD2086157.1 sulfate permease [Halomonas meridiana]PHR04588.1 MAG: sodium-independent anion transporter [Halomonas sp.]HAV45449.1 sodium-independent anion transporter [Halomonas sp.]|tara:strand:- start:259 stop:1962 length:1704 start_codon:yes stop_codon:yes gene_type:complete